jgi:hypothetical protein
VLGAQCPSKSISPLEAHVGYVLSAAFIVLVICVVVGAMHVRHENRIAERPPRPAMRRRAVRRAAPADRCRCGGTVRRIPDPSGDLLGCTGCHRKWTMDGHRITRIIRR